VEAEVEVEVEVEAEVEAEAGVCMVGLSTEGGRRWVKFRTVVNESMVSRRVRGRGV